MKNKIRFLFAWLLIFAVHSAFCQTKIIHFNIEGDVANIDGNYVFYKYFQDNLDRIYDSAIVTNNRFSIKGIVSEPTCVNIYLPYNGNEVLKQLFVDPGRMIIKGDLKNASEIKIYGLSSQKNLEELNDRLNDNTADLNTKYKSLLVAGESDATINKIATQIRKERIKNFEKMLSNQATNTALPWYLYDASLSLKTEELDLYFSKLNEAAKQSKYGKMIAKMIEINQNTAVGKNFLDITASDTSGKNTQLSQVKSTYILVDFWASWCAPCRAENPNLVNAYKKYHEKGLEIFAVSLDDNIDKWKAAIKKDGLSWLHVSELLGWNGSISKMYGIRSIPSNVLISKEGKIIAKNLRGAELDSKLQELLK